MTTTGTVDRLARADEAVSAAKSRFFAHVGHGGKQAADGPKRVGVKPSGCHDCCVAWWRPGMSMGSPPRKDAFCAKGACGAVVTTSTAQAFAAFGRNERWGTCVDCPRTTDHVVFPEFCVNAKRYDHGLTLGDLVKAYQREKK